MVKSKRIRWTEQ